MRHYNEIKPWANVTEEEWNDWRWQVRNRINDVELLKEVIDMTEQEELDVGEVLKKFRVGITPYYASLMDPKDHKCPVRLQAVPTIMETYESESDMEDPLDEDVDSP
ncbi:MAG: lysine 2,3-aminomutase, partial [Tissierellia bacterium]|nr:lysine 2,3-aminomutase [Tissierellia bacterium]